MVVYLVKIRKTNALDDIHDEGFTSLADLYEKKTKNTAKIRLCT